MTINNKIASYPSVCIIILNWKGWNDTIECLESLFQITYLNYNVILIDNDSKDESIQKIKEYCKGNIPLKSKFFKYDLNNKPIKTIEYTNSEINDECGKESEIENLPSNRKLTIIKNDNNYGFAEGNNIGIRYAIKVLNSDYVLLLNNDTVVDKGFLCELVKYGEKFKQVGILQPRILKYYKPDVVDYNEIGLLYKIIFFLPIQKVQLFLYNAKSIDYPHRVEATSLCCALIRKNVFERIGLLDPEFFYGGCDNVDFSFRATRSFFNLLFLPSSNIWHKGGKSGASKSDTYWYLIAKNKVICARKNLRPSSIQYLMFTMSFFIFQIPKWFLHSIILNKRISQLLCIIKGSCDGFRYPINQQIDR